MLQDCKAFGALAWLRNKPEARQKGQPSPSTAVGSSTPALKIFVSVVQQSAATLDSREVVLMRQTYAGNDMRDAGRLLACKLIVLEIDVVNDVRDRP